MVAPYHHTGAILTRQTDEISVWRDLLLFLYEHGNDAGSALVPLGSGSVSSRVNVAIMF